MFFWYPPVSMTSFAKIRYTDFCIRGAPRALLPRHGQPVFFIANLHFLALRSDHSCKFTAVIVAIVQHSKREGVDDNRSADHHDFLTAFVA